MVYLRSRLAAFIKEKRGSMSQREFARRSGLAQSTIMRIENQDQNVTIKTLERLCQVFRVDVAELFPPLEVKRPYTRAQAQPGLVHEKPPSKPGGKKKG